MEELHEGYRFHPKDSELLTFLMRFIAGKDLRDDGYIRIYDAYKQEPWITYGHGCHCGGKDTGDTSINRYFITPRNKKKDDGSRFIRTVGENIGTVDEKRLGTWKQQDKGKDVTMSSCGNLSKSLTIGRKKSLCYETYKSSSDDDDGNWHMKEYVLCENILRKFRKYERKDYAICAIRKMPKRNSSKGTQSSNVRTSKGYSAQQMVDVKVKSEVNSVELLMDQGYNAITPINIVEPMVESDEPEVQIQEAAAVLGLTTFSQIQEFENTMPEISRPEEPVMLDKNQPQHQLAPLQEGCSFGVNEDHIAYLELEATNHTRFVELLSGGTDSALRNSQVQTQEAPGDENGQLEPNTFSQIQEPVVPDFADMKSEVNMREIIDTLAEFTGFTVLMHPDYELINPFDFSKQAIVESCEPQVQTQEAAGEENGMLGLTAPFSQIQEFVMLENNVTEMFDTGDTVLEQNQTQHQPAPQEESETLCEREESSFVPDLVEALLDNATMKNRLDAIRTNESTFLLDQQSWQSKAHLQDMLL